MKKFLIIGMILSLGACADFSAFTSNTVGSGSSESIRGKMHSCLLSEAQSRLQAGTLFNDSISVTAKSIVGSCAQKLALSSAGIDTETQKSAENIIANLRNLNTNQ